MNRSRRTRSQLVIDVTKLIISKYPVRWNAKEISHMTGANLRTINRVLAEMSESGLLDKKHQSYSLPLNVVSQFYGAKWYVKQEIDKEIIIHKKGDKNEG
ncbi:MAG: helix-turn-helix domain-containing protein [Spirochaetota bacterium]